jgi:hypothetical protein
MVDQLRIVAWPFVAILHEVPDDLMTYGCFCEAQARRCADTKHLYEAVQHERHKQKSIAGQHQNTKISHLCVALVALAWIFPASVVYP